MFEIAPTIIDWFSQDESSGGAPGTIDVYERGTVTTDPTTGHRELGTREKVGVIHGNIAPATQKDVEADTTGLLRRGDIIVFSTSPLSVGDEATQESARLVLHQGDWYRLRVADSWHYAQGSRYIGTRERGESGV